MVMQPVEWPWLVCEYTAAEYSIVMLCYGLSVRHNNIGSGWAGERLKNVAQKRNEKKKGSVNSLR